VGGLDEKELLRAEPFAQQKEGIDREVELGVLEAA
jgi:hypothetical protein